jgi:predicted Rossmann fold nucleotide-binding protein DprA/Smf involved in DNA uptake
MAMERRNQGNTAARRTWTVGMPEVGPSPGSPLTVPPPGIGHNNPPGAERIAVVGSRDFSNFRLLTEILSEYRDQIRLMISGGADGADRMGARWARKNGIPTEIFKPDHKKYKHAYHHRNRLIAESCQLLVAFWNGHSTGTAYTID